MAVEGLSKSLCKAPEAAVQRRCGDRPWRWKGCKWRYMLRNNTVNADLQPLSQLRCQHYQGTPTEASADLQPLSQLALPAPLTQGSLCGECRTTTPQSATLPAPLTQGSLSKYVQTLFSSTRQCLPCVRGGGPPVAVEGLSKSLCKGAGSCRAAEVWGPRWRWRGCKWLYMLRNNTVNTDLQPLSQLRCRHYQGAPTEASADLQPLSQLRCQLPLHRGA